MRDVILGKDNPIMDEEYPVGIESFTCDTTEATLFGVIYYAEGSKNPTVVMCHGCPGLEKNHDIAQNLRQAGFNTIIFSYRGAWGSLGKFSFSGIVDDTVNVLRQVKDCCLPRNERFDPDPEKIVLMGYSTGCFAAMQAAASEDYIKHIALLAPWNIGADAKVMSKDAAVKKRVKSILEATAKYMVGATEDNLLKEIVKKADDFDLCSIAGSFNNKKILLIGAKGDSYTPIGVHQRPLVDELVKEKADVSAHELVCDHYFSSKRNEITRIILDWLKKCGF